MLGEFDLSSDSDTYDAKRQTIVEAQKLSRLIFSIIARKNVQLEIDPIVHENYQSPQPYSNDIALLKLAEAVDLATYAPACLAAKDADYTGQNGRVYGKYDTIIVDQKCQLLFLSPFQYRYNITLIFVIFRMGPHSLCLISNTIPL